MATRAEIFQLVASFSGQANVVTIPVAFIEITGDMQLGALLAQAVYWTDKLPPDRHGWFYKSSDEWQREIHVTDYAVRKFKQLPYILTEKRKANGAPTLHWKVDTNLLTDTISEWIRGKQRNESLSSTNPGLVESNESLTEITKRSQQKKNQPENTTNENWKPLIAGIVDVTAFKMELTSTRGRVLRCAKELDKIKVTGDLVRQFYNQWWLTNHWKGKKNPPERPLPEEILSEWGRFEEFRFGTEIDTLSPEEELERRREMANKEL